MRCGKPLPAKPKPRLPEYVRRTIKEALKSARLERCGVDEAAQNAMKLYLDTWVVAPLAALNDYADGGEVDVSRQGTLYQRRRPGGV